MDLIKTSLSSSENKQLARFVANSLKKAALQCTDHPVLHTFFTNFSAAIEQGHKESKERRLVIELLCDNYDFLHNYSISVPKNDHDLDLALKNALDYKNLASIPEITYSYIRREMDKCLSVSINKILEIIDTVLQQSRRRTLKNVLFKLEPLSHIDNAQFAHNKPLAIKAIETTTIYFDGEWPLLSNGSQRAALKIDVYSEELRVREMYNSKYKIMTKQELYELSEGDIFLVGHYRITILQVTTQLVQLQYFDIENNEYSSIKYIKDECSIGTEETNTISLKGDDIEKIHAKINRSSTGQWRLQSQ